MNLPTANFKFCFEETRMYKNYNSLIKGAFGFTRQCVSTLADSVKPFTLCFAEEATVPPS
jgi:hypothetical protein